MRKAVIDVGSNSVLLVVEERTDGQWRTIQEAAEVTALGEGTKSTRLLGEPGMAATLAAVARMYEQAHANGAGEVVAAATMAARIAENTPEFLHRAAAQGTPIVVLSGDDEAEYGFRAVADDPTFARFDRLSIVDPGGQSTEMVTADRGEGDWTIRFRRSFPIGTLGLRSEILCAEASDPSSILAASAAIDDVISLCYRPGEVGELVVLGATGTNLVSIRDRLEAWQPEKVHGAYLDFEEISRAVGWMMPMTDAERRAIVGMEPGRERTIHIGALVLERFLNATGAPGAWVSVRGWRHAVLERL